MVKLKSKNEKQKLKIKKYPNFNEEIKCWKQGYRFIAGVDEAGRGPLAGPVTAAAVMVRQFPISPPAPRLRRAGNFQFPKIRDSKQLTARQREAWYKILTTHLDIKWGVGVVSEKIIDKINIFEATKLAMKRAIGDLERKCYKFYDRKNCNIETEKTRTEFLILDGNFSIQIAQIHANAPMRMVPCKSIIRADEKVFSCAAASIIAKVTRDRLMQKYVKKYPEYGFEKHKGYGTLLHRRALTNYGPCPIHRKSFRFRRA